MLENDFEDYEVITSKFAFWIIEFKGAVNHVVRMDFQDLLNGKFGDKKDEIILNVMDVTKIDEIIEEVMGSYLLNEIDKKIQNIDLILIKKEYD